MIKNSSSIVQDRIVSQFNNIFNTYIPQSYKTSLIIPILKPNKNKTDISSYRPISLNCCIGKILDKIISQRLWWFLTNNKLIHPNQFGFKKGKSTSDSLLFVDHLITKSLNTKKHISLVSLDFARAFDRVGAHSIIDQVIYWKCGPKIINYVKNFMSNLEITVRVGTQNSSIRLLNNGIPQGSPTSVVLFIIAFNKLANIISRHKQINFSTYADDFFIIINLKKNKNIIYNRNPLFLDIENWGN